MRESPGATQDQQSSDGAVLLDDGTVVMAQAVLPVWGRQLDAIHDQLNQGIGELTLALANLSQLHDELGEQGLGSPEQALQALQRLLPALQEQGMHALAGLQIGDRLSQMLTVVRADVQRLVDEMPLLGTAGKQRADEWLQELKAQYTTPEQHRMHGEEAASSGSASSGVDFF